MTYKSQRRSGDVRILQKNSATVLTESVKHNFAEKISIRLQERIAALLHRAVELAKTKNVLHPRVLIYGINDTADILLSGSPMNGIDVVALTDSFKWERYTEYKNVPVVPPDVAAQLDVDLAIVVTFNEVWRDEMVATLVRFGAEFPIVVFDKLCKQYAESLFISHPELNRFIDLTWRLPKASVVFVAKMVNYNQLRMSVALRRRGWRTVSVVFDEYISSQHEPYFDFVFQVNFGTFIKSLPKLGPVILHTQGWMFSNHIPVMIDADRPDHSFHIVEFLDVHQFLNPPEHEEKMLPYMVQAWASEKKVDFRLVNAFELNCEQHIIQYADGVIFSGSDKQKSTLMVNSEIAGRAIDFQCFPLPDFFVDLSPVTTSAPWHLAFAGGVIPFGDKFPRQIFGDAQIYGISELLASQGLYIHIFNNPYLARGDRLGERYPEYVELAQKNTFVDFSEGTFPWDLGFKIGHYHYGMMLYLFDGLLIGEQHFETVIPSKVFTYIEAGLPVLVSRRFSAVCEIVERYEIGICIDDSELSDIVPILDRADYIQLRKNVRTFRQVLNMDRQIQQLIDFYESTRESAN